MTTELGYRSIKELAPKPSDAIKAMLDGLRDLPSDKFRVDMGTFGSTLGNQSICYGCAATCAVYKLADKVPGMQDVVSRAARSEHLRFSVQELDAFEGAINAFRMGFMGDLFRFYGVMDRYVHPSTFWSLGTYSWPQQIEAVEDYYKTLVALGL